MHWWMRLSRELSGYVDRNCDCDAIVRNCSTCNCNHVFENVRQKSTFADQYLVPRQCIAFTGDARIRVLRIACHLLPALFTFFQVFRDRINWFASCRSLVNHLLVHMAVSHAFRLRCYQITDNGITCDFDTRVRYGAVTSLSLLLLGYNFDLSRVYKDRIF